jgi:hypothetical protein
MSLSSTVPPSDSAESPKHTNFFAGTIFIGRITVHFRV